MKKIDNAIRNTFFGNYDTFRLTIVILLIISLFRLIVQAMGLIELSGDEAQYWEWSRRMDWCYYSKPPGVAALIWSGTHIFGNNESGVRFMAIVCSFIASMAIYHLVKTMYDGRTGSIAAVLYQIVPAFGIYGIGMTPDTPLLMFWCLGLLFFYLAVEKEKKICWIYLTLSIGLAMLCKYAIVFFLVPAALYMIFNTQGRKSLKSFWPYTSFILSLSFFLPVIYWNSNNNWVTFKHDLGHINAAEGLTFSFEYILNFLAGQLMVVTPVTAILILALIIRQWHKYSFSFWFCIPILLCFLIKSIQGKIQANWVATAWIAGIIPMSHFFAVDYWNLEVANKWRNISRSAISIPAVVMIIIHCAFILQVVPWPNEIDPIKRLTGWKQLAAEVDRQLADMETPCFIVSDYYMISAELAFYCVDNPITYYVNIGNSRMNQYDLWPGVTDKIGQNAIFVPRKGIKEAIYNAFDRIEIEEFSTTDLYGKNLQTYRICKCYGFKGIEVKKTALY